MSRERSQHVSPLASVFNNALPPIKEHSDSFWFAVGRQLSSEFFSPLTDRKTLIILSSTRVRKKPSQKMFACLESFLCL